MITLALPNNPSQSQFLDCVRKACWSAAAEGRGTALVVSGQLALHQWNSLYLLMKEGSVNGEGKGREGGGEGEGSCVCVQLESTLNTGLQCNLEVCVMWCVV